jgi:hypothetical protein
MWIVLGKYNIYKLLSASNIEKLLVWSHNCLTSRQNVRQSSWKKETLPWSFLPVIRFYDFYFLYSIFISIFFNLIILYFFKTNLFLFFIILCHNKNNRLYSFSHHYKINSSIQGVSGGIVNILCGGSMDYSE